MEDVQRAGLQCGGDKGAQDFTADIVQVSLIPFTLQHTTLAERRPGDQVHLEGDTIGKYVRRFAAAHLKGMKG